MRTFDYEKLAAFLWDNEVLRSVARIHECKGRQTAFGAFRGVFLHENFYRTALVKNTILL